MRDLTFVGVSGEKLWSKAKFTSQFLMGETEDECSFLDRSLIRFNGEMSVGALKFTGSAAQAGNDFSGQKPYGVAAGSQTSNIAVRFAPDGSKVQGSAAISSSENAAGTLRNTAEQKVMYNAAGLQAAIQCTSVDTDAAGSRSSIDTTSLAVNKQFDKATASVSIRDVTINDTDNQVSTVTSITAKPNSRLSISAVRSTADTNSNTRVFVKANPLSNLELQSTVITDDTTGCHKNIAVATTLLPRVKFSAAFAQDKVNSCVRDSIKTGIVFDVGSIGVTTNLATRNEYLNQPEERMLTLSYPSVGLNAGYKVVELLDGHQTSTLTMGYKRSVNALFSLSFTGCCVQHSDGLADSYTFNFSAGITF